MNLLYHFLILLASIQAFVRSYSTGQRLSSPQYVNPVLPGWHSDPSCIQNQGIFFCVTSTFLAFPGLPVYASRDLVGWNLISHVWNRESQLPGISWNTTGQADGMYAPTMRYHNGIYYVLCAYVGLSDEPMGVLFQTTDPFHSAQWSDPTILNLKEIDPDLFWDDDGKTYVATAGITLQEVDLKSGKLGEPLNIWNGTANEWPEGPHIYKKDGWYYLLIAEGGTGQGHAVSMARARSITGPYTAYKNNPILTNRDTNEYFQSVGHADLFQTSNGDWWGVCLAIRTGPSYELMPMGREAALFNVTWKRGEWPQLQPVRGRMSGDRLPGVHLPALGNGPTAAGDDGYDFTEVTTMPPHFIHHRVPPPNASSVTRKGLMIKPSRANLTGDSGSTELELTGQRGLSLIGRRQAHTLFAFSLDLEFRPQADGQEAGITVFRSQHEHINLGIVRMESKSRHGARSQLVFRLAGASPSTKVSMQIYQVPQSWEKGTIRLEIQASNASVYTFAAMPVKAPQRRMVIGTVSAGAVSGLGGKGFFLGSFIGAFATCNGAGSGQKCPEGGDVLITRWIYKGLGQQILVDEIVPEVGLVSP